MSYEEISKNFTYMPNGIARSNIIEPEITAINWGTDWIEFKYKNTGVQTFDLYADINTSKPTTFRGTLGFGGTKIIRYNNLLPGTTYFTYAKFDDYSVAFNFGTTSTSTGGDIQPWSVEPWSVEIGLDEENSRLIID